jgi:N-acetylglucosamine-6-phosphate deacetylase
LIENGAVVIEDGLISAVGTRSEVEIPQNVRVVDFADSILAPGLIDIHVHGGAGHDVMEQSDDGLAEIERFMALHGVTSYCPTTVTAPIDTTLKSLQHLGRATRHAESRISENRDRARPLGIHLEGPFLSHARRGVHPPNLLREASIELFEKMWNAADGKILVLTIAPEIDGALGLIAEASRREVCVSLGHSDANFEQAQAGIRAGARHATHTFNAMRPLNHRDPGLLGAVLTDRHLTADIIVDGIHVDCTIVDLFVRAKGLDKAVLITDAISATGMPDGKYILGGFEVEVREGRCEAGGRLAGSVLTLDKAVRSVKNFADISLQNSICMASLNPAKVLGIQNRKGVLKVGADADIAVFSREGDVIRTIIGGVLD